MDQMKVLLVLCDGLRPDCIRDHPAITFLRERGSWCMDARTVFPPVTLPLPHVPVPQRGPGAARDHDQRLCAPGPPGAGAVRAVWPKGGLRCAMYYKLGGAAGPGPAREPGSEPVYLGLCLRKRGGHQGDLRPGHGGAAGRRDGFRLPVPGVDRRRGSRLRLGESRVPAGRPGELRHGGGAGGGTERGSTPFSSPRTTEATTGPTGWTSPRT